VGIVGDRPRVRPRRRLDLRRPVPRRRPRGERVERLCDLGDRLPDLDGGSGAAVARHHPAPEVGRHRAVDDRGEVRRRDRGALAVPADQRHEVPVPLVVGAAVELEDEGDHRHHHVRQLVGHVAVPRRARLRERGLDALEQAMPGLEDVGDADRRGHHVAPEHPGPERRDQRGLDRGPVGELDVREHRAAGLAIPDARAREHAPRVALDERHAREDISREHGGPYGYDREAIGIAAPPSTVDVLGFLGFIGFIVSVVAGALIQGL
jgi:hypothetical protein